MNIETFRLYCLAKPHVEEAFPFDEDTLVFKLNNKIFGITSLDKPNSCNLKCDPERAVSLRESYSGIIPGWHMNKMHWNTVSFDEDVADSLIYELIDHSYDLIMKSFSKKIQEELRK